MKVDFELTENDHESIATKVIQIQSDKAFMEGVYKTSEAAAKKKYWTAFESLHSNLEMSELLDKNLKQYIMAIIGDGDLVGKEIRKAINSDDIKKVTAQALRDKACQLENEANAILEGDELD